MADASGVRPVRLLVEGSTHCLTAGSTPRLSWQAEAPHDASPVGTVPVAAEPEVRAADGPLLWAPGPIPLPRHATTRVIIPAEAALPSDAECRWRVRLQSADGVWGPWSEEQSFGTGLRDGDWSAQWIAREPGGRSPLRMAERALRWHGTPFLAIPATAGSDFVLEAELRPVLGAAGIAFHSAGPGTGLLVELTHGGRVALRPLPLWNQPAEPAEWTTAPLAESFVEPRVWHHLRIEARGGRLAVAVDGQHALGAELPEPAGDLLALHAEPRAEGALRSLQLLDGWGRASYRYDSADGLDGWPETTPFRQPDEWTLLRAEIPLRAPVRRAVLFGAARHQAWVSVAGHEALALSSFGYPGEDYYDAADVTEALRASGCTTALRAAVEILAHWYGPGQGRASTEPGVLAELRIEYDDGSRQTLATGPEWLVAEAPYGQAGYRNDEGDPIEHALGEQAAVWSAARVIGPHPNPQFPALHPRRAHVAEFRDAPVQWLEADDGTPVADFGTVRARRPKAEFASAGTNRLRAGYVLRPDGRVDDSTTASQNTDMSFLSGSAAQRADNFEARVHLGFRYLEIEGPRPAQLDAAVVHAAHPAEAAVETSDPELNRILRLLQDSALHGVQERFVDTPTREKGQFLADAANISYATMAAFGEREFTRQALREFAWSGERYWDSPEERGRVNAVYPNGDGKRDIPDFSLMLPEWAEAYWLHTGDEAFIAGLLPTLEATCGYALRSIPDSGPFEGLVTRLEGGSGPYLHGIVDWPAPNRFGYDMETVARTTVNAQAYSGLEATARLCALLGRERRAAQLRERAAELAAAMERRLRVGGTFVDGLLADGTPSQHASQHATVFPLAVGAASPDWRAHDVARAAAFGLRMGPMTWHRLLAVLVAEGRVDDALGVVLDDPSRGPLSWLARGATFTWESWDLAPGSDHSQSHAWSAAGWPVLVDGILGLRRRAPGLLEIQPPDCRLEWVRAELPLEQGTLRIAWQRTHEGINLECDAPPGVGAPQEPFKRR